jgi:hypothetical protein
MPLSSSLIPEEIMFLSNLGTINVFMIIKLRISLVYLIAFITKKVKLDFTETQLASSIPTELGRSHQIQYISLSKTKIFGTLPSELGNLSQLTCLKLNNLPNLSGDLPDEILNLPSLKTLDITSTDVTIRNPSLLCNRSEPVEVIIDDWEYECLCCTHG